MERVSTVPAADRFEIHQLIRPMVNLYTISAHGSPVAFVRQKRMAIKEDIRFFRNENESEELFRIKARSLMELGARYDVTAADGEKIGVLGKVFGKSLFRSTWSIMDANEQELAVAQERSLVTAIIRRVIDAVPYGEFVPIIFHFTIDRGETHLGDFTRAIGMRDRYTLDLGGDVEQTIDRRLAIALAVALDALQSR
jgi:uncharacterized protein YxjI